jgi:hypothetical protein
MLGTLPIECTQSISTIYIFSMLNSTCYREQIFHSYTVYYITNTRDTQVKTYTRWLSTSTHPIHMPHLKKKSRKALRGLLRTRETIEVDE